MAHNHPITIVSYLDLTSTSSSCTSPAMRRGGTDDTIHRPDREPEGESGQHLARLCQYHHVLQFVCGVWLSFAVCEAAYSTGSFSTGGTGGRGESKSGSARNDAELRSRENADTTCARHSKSTPPRVHCARATATMGKQNRQTKLKPPGAKSSGSSSSSQNLIPLLLSGAALLFALMMHPVLSKKLFGFGASDIPPPLDASSSQRASSKTPSASCDAPDEGSVMCEAWHKAGLSWLRRRRVEKRVGFPRACHR